MKIELNDDSVDQYGRQIQLYVDDEGAELLKSFVNAVQQMNADINTQLYGDLENWKPIGVINSK